MMNSCKMKVGAYIRLSKEDEKEGESESVTNQRELILKYVNQNNLGECEFLLMMDIAVEILRDQILKE